MKPTVEFKRVPTTDKYFNLLEAISRSDIWVSVRWPGLMGTTDGVHTLWAFGILENGRENRFVFGSGLSALWKDDWLWTAQGQGW